MILSLSLCLVSACPPPQAEFDAYLKASNTGQSDRFTRSVAISCDTIVVGARDEGSSATGVNGTQLNGAPDSGAAYVYVRSGTTWIQQAYLKASNTDPADWYAVSVAIDGDTIVVGASREDSSASGIDGDQSDNSVDSAGAAYVYVRSGTTWTQEAYLKASNPGELDHFGSSVAVSGDTVVVGARFEHSGASGVNADQTDDSAMNAGAVYVFVRSGSTWSQEAYIKASNAGTRDEFGFSISIDGDTMVVGAPAEDSGATDINGDQGNTATGAGAAYVFVRTGSTWSQEAYLKASNADPGDEFGTAVTMHDNTVVVGAPAERSFATGIDGGALNNASLYAGAAYVFVKNGTSWSQQAYVKPSNTAGGYFFGESLSFHDDVLVVGASGEDSPSPAGGNSINSGAAYVFEREGLTWSERQKLKAPVGGFEDRFGFRCALSDETVVVGAYLEDSGSTGIDGDATNNDQVNSGAAYVFDLAPLFTGPEFCSGDGGDQAGCTDCPCGNNACVGVIGGCINGVGTSCRLISSGLASLSNDTLSFTITGANPATSARLASAVNALPNVGPCPSGSGIVSAFAMDGLRCIGGNLVRHGVRATDANGATPVSWGPPAPNPPNGILAQGGFAAGQIRYFQTFYREDPMLGCGTGQNTSNAVGVVVIP